MQDSKNKGHIRTQNILDSANSAYFHKDNIEERCYCKYGAQKGRPYIFNNTRIYIQLTIKKNPYSDD